MVMEKIMVELRAITEENFIDAFNLKLAPGQEEYVSHPIRSLAQAYVYRNQCQPFGIYAEDKMIGYVMVIYDYDVPEYDIWHMMIDESMRFLQITVPCAKRGIHERVGIIYPRKRRKRLGK